MGPAFCRMFRNRGARLGVPRPEEFARRVADACLDTALQAIPNILESRLSDFFRRAHRFLRFRPCDWDADGWKVRVLTRRTRRKCRLGTCLQWRPVPVGKGPL